MQAWRWMSVAVTAAMLGLAGCGQYVNIPADPQDVAANDPNLGNVQDVAVASVQALVEDATPTGNFRVILPAGTRETTYQAVVKELGDKATWSATAPAEGEYVLDVRNVRIRSWLAQVDVVRPASVKQPGGMKQLTSVYLSFSFAKGWTADRMHLWRIPLEEALFQARHEEINAQPISKPE